jgi:glyoxylase-like metal-dependent hydrolase (beta-lactamase superfamily II)
MSPTPRAVLAGEPLPPSLSGVVRVRAANPSPHTLDGTNTYVVAGWVVDPGPADPDHQSAVLAAAGGAAGLRGIVVTHGHADHAGGAPALAALGGGVPVRAPADGEAVGPFRAVRTPGHTSDSVCLLLGAACFTGDTVLGAGSVYISPGGGSLASYLESLERLRALDLEVLCPGHGPLVLDPAAKLDAYLEHRLERERRLLAALGEGVQKREELLDRVWVDAPAPLRRAASMTLDAHLEKLRDEGRLPFAPEG